MTYYWTYKDRESAVLSIKANNKQAAEKILEKIVADKEKWEFRMDTGVHLVLNK